MALTTEHYLSQLQALLPQGLAWAKRQDSALARLLSAFADEFARIDARLERLLDEADPRTTSELLYDWERVAGLPDDCVGESGSLSERRTLLVAKITNVGGQSPQFFIDLAASLGYTVTITEFNPYTVDSYVNDSLYGIYWVFVWQVNAALNTVRRFTVGGFVNDPLASWGNTILECAIGEMKPAHTTVHFSYT